MRSAIVVAAALLLVTFARGAAAAEPPAAKPIQVLLVTGVDHPAHHWRETAPVLAALLERDPRISVHLLDNPNSLGSAALDRYQAIVLHFMNWKVPAPDEAAQANLKKAVAAGKGLVLIHFACGAWQDWPEFVNIAGRVWNPKFRSHDRRGPFHVEIVDPQHPITQNLQSFDTDDELYTCLDGKPPVHVLATARSKVDSKDYPMAFVWSYGQGRVFHCVLGHDVKAMGFDGVGELYRRGTAWAAGFAPVAK
jgi:type 1 glutamine amidotransferase